MDGVPFGWTTAIKFPEPQSKDQTVGEPDRNCRVHQLPSIGDVPIEEAVNEHDDRQNVEDVDDGNRPNREPTDKARLFWVAIGVPEGEKDNWNGFEHDNQPLWPKHNLIGQYLVEQDAREERDRGRPPSNCPSIFASFCRKDVSIRQ